jgi:hypothetical protein
MDIGISSDTLLLVVTTSYTKYSSSELPCLFPNLYLSLHRCHAPRKVDETMKGSTKRSRIELIFAYVSRYLKLQHLQYTLYKLV